jgi:hypothetical protein
MEREHRIAGLKVGLNVNEVVKLSKCRPFVNRYLNDTIQVWDAPGLNLYFRDDVLREIRGEFLETGGQTFVKYKSTKLSILECLGPPDFTKKDVWKNSLGRFNVELLCYGSLQIAIVDDLVEGAKRLDQPRFFLAVLGKLDISWLDRTRLFFERYISLWSFQRSLNIASVLKDCLRSLE